MESNRILAHAEALLHRLTPEARAAAARRRARRRAAIARRIVRAATAVLAVVLVAGGIGMVTPIGPFGFLLTMIAMAAVAAMILFWPGEGETSPETLVKTDLAQLPHRTEVWLESQRAALPAPAARLVDGIGIRLEALAPQLATLDPREPAAFEVRKLIGEELPELIDGYRRVPEPLRRGTRNGSSPDKQLLEGLQVVDSELKRMCEQLASGDLHKLATQRRYLELKYQGDAPASE